MVKMTNFVLYTFYYNFHKIKFRKRPRYKGRVSVTSKNGNKIICNLVTISKMEDKVKSMPVFGIRSTFKFRGKSKHR
jgi:hypothetical protein